MTLERGAQMCASECNDRLRFSLSDDSGVLRFEEFAIVDGLNCQDVEHTLREYLVGRSLADVDLDFLRGLNCPADGECLRALIGAIQKHQQLFIGEIRTSPKSG
jgi:hypothetical protein